MSSDVAFDLPIPRHIISDIGFQIKSIPDFRTTILYLLTYLILQKTSRTGNIITPFLQWEKLRQEEIWWFPQRYLTVSKL